MDAIRDQRGPRAEDIDRYIGGRMCERRVILRLTLQQLAEQIGVSYQQAHKYEKGVDRIASGRLFLLAHALGVEVGYFYEGLGAENGSLNATQRQRLVLELARNFIAIRNRKRQEAVCDLVRAIADPEQIGRRGSKDDSRPGAGAA